MKKLTLTVALVAATLGGIATAPAHAQVGVSINIGAPPAPRYEPMPPPRVGYVWAPGFWDWDGHRHEWRGGHWERDRPGYAYRAPAWHQGPHGWALSRGGWDRGDRGRGPDRRDDHDRGRGHGHDGRDHGRDHRN
ncbi:YXWGXW repeat-containing protein [Pandoraea soli]|uniref:Signal peptide protein n=1 Tax=Pandoraea soli TaxID=2508293 RepID=A0ABY6W3K2_9BURK|nr:YXWGXW repeat-containing protein [Pandoraea soli]VVE22433.1 putative signal peptide protein [Pandoraea soli]